jgi:YggT family protein
MVIYYVIQIIHFIARLLMILIMVDVVLSYFMSPFHPVRRIVDRVIEPMLSPIRRVVPLVANIDFSPLVLLLLVEIFETLLVGLFSTLL